jgi:hypothetical protein
MTMKAKLPYQADRTFLHHFLLTALLKIMLIKFLTDSKLLQANSSDHMY